MTTLVAPFRSDVPIGFVGPQRLPVLGSEFFIRYLNQQILDRIGGTSQLSSTELAALVDQIESASIPPSEQAAQTANQAVDELRNEISSLRNECDQLRNIISERESQLVALQTITDLRLRVEQLEDQRP